MHLDAELYANKLGAPEHWRILYEDIERQMGWRHYSDATEYWQILPNGLKRIERTPGWDPPLWSSIDHPVQAHEFFDMAINYWLELANVRPAFSSFEKAKRVMLRGGGLFGALVSQILFAVGRSKGLAFCTGCGSVYNPTRLPNSRRRNYCPDCRPRAQADASKDYRRCMAKARELSAKGMSVEEIAEQLNRDPERVKKWVQQPRRR